MPDDILSRYVEVAGKLRREDEPAVAALDRGFTLGDGVFETIRVAGGKAFRLSQHLARLRRSASVLSIPVAWTNAQLSSSIDRVLAANDLTEAVVRITVSRGVPNERGLLPPARPLPTLVTQAGAYHALAPEKVAAGYRAVTSFIRRNEHSPLSQIKSCNYLDSVLAKLEAQRAGVDEAILLNTAGAVACCTAANIFLVEGDRLLTPAPRCGVLAGITRVVVRELAAKLGLSFVEAVLGPERMALAQEVFLTNSVLGIMAVTNVDGQAIGDATPGQATRRLAREYEAVLKHPRQDSNP